MFEPRTAHSHQSRVGVALVSSLIGFGFTTELTRSPRDPSSGSCGQVSRCCNG